jgi:hypothetical protein
LISNFDRKGRETKESRMSHGNEASASAIDDVIAEAVRELDLEDKVQLLTGAAAFLCTATKPSACVP